MEKLNPVDWTYIVQSKAGKMFPFRTIEEAEEAAKRKSTRSSYSVYHDGKFVSCFAGNKKMPEWKTVYRWVNEHSTDRYHEIMKSCPHFNVYNNAVPVNVYREDYDFTVDICEEKIRLKRRDWCVSILPGGKKKYFFDSSALSLYNSGRAVKNHGSRISSELYFSFPDEIQDEVYAIVYKEMLSRRPELKQVLENCRDFYELLIGYTHPNARFITDDYKHLIRRRTYEWPNENINDSWYPNTLTNEADLIPAICKKLRIPCTKTLKKLFIRNIQNIRYAKTLVGYGFKDVNNILKLSGAVEYCSGYVDPLAAKVARKFIKFRSENWFAKHVQSEGLHEFRDAIKMIKEGNIDERIVDFAVKECRNFSEFHDTIMAHFQTPARKTRTIKYTKEEVKRFNHRYGDIVFELATDNKDLAIIGASMGICVGSYAGEAISHRTTIVKMTKNDEYIACIEVKNNCLEQLKAHYNNPVKIEYKEVVDNWIKDAKIDPRCYDYAHMGDKWNSTHNYAHVNPAEFENRHRAPKALEIVRRAPRFNEHFESVWLDTPEKEAKRAKCEPEEFPF